MQPTTCLHSTAQHAALLQLQLLENTLADASNEFQTVSDESGFKNKRLN